ncbi:non-homologous end joining factor IFFO1-like [Cetorhinus maximus]
MNSLLGPNFFLLQPPPVDPLSPEEEQEPVSLLGEPLALSGPYPPTMALRNDLGSNISVLKTLNLRFRCFLAKVHELERRNRALEKQLQQQSLRGVGRTSTRDQAVQTGLPSGLSLSQARAPGLGLGQGLGPGLGQGLGPGVGPGLSLGPGSSPLASLRPQASSGLLWGPGQPRPDPLLRPGERLPWGGGGGGGGGGCGARPDGIGVQTDTITPEIRALYNVLGKVKRRGMS